MAVDVGVTLMDVLTAPGETFELVRVGPEGSGGLVYRNAPRSLRDVLIQAGASADDADYIAYQDRQLSSADHDRRCRQLATHLHDAVGVQRGDRVAIAMRNLPEFSIAFWALQAIGAIAVPLNSWSAGPELAAAIRHSGSTVLIADGARWERLRPENGGLDLRAILVTGADSSAADPTDPEVALTGLSTVFDGPAFDSYPVVDVGPDDAATIVYTSGTTGSPKGAVHTHRNYCSGIMHNLLHTELNLREHAGKTAGAPAGPGEKPSRDCILLTYPLFHIAGLINLGLSMGSRIRKKLVLMHHWDPVVAADLIVDEQVTSALLVPTTLRSLLADGGRLAAAPDLRLRFVAAGGASVPGELIDRIDELFGGRVLPGNGYGLTETTAGVIAGSGDEYVRNPTSVGRPMPAMEIRIVGFDESDVEVGQVGEIVVRGPSVCAGYWNNPEETARNFPDGWFHTGDLGKIDANGLYYVVDRIKDVIIRGGENIFCPEVEATLENHPDVLEAAVFSLPSAEFGEIVGAVVRCRPGTGIDEQALRDHVGLHLAYFKVPATIVLIDGDLPRTASGKVLKKNLRSFF